MDGATPMPTTENGVTTTDPFATPEPQMRVASSLEAETLAEIHRCWRVYRPEVAHLHIGRALKRYREATADD
jgi:hypothetical protein